MLIFWQLKPSCLWKSTRCFHLGDVGRLSQCVRLLRRSSGPVILSSSCACFQPRKREGRETSPAPWEGIRRERGGRRVSGVCVDVGKMWLKVESQNWMWEDTELDWTGWPESNWCFFQGWENEMVEKTRFLRPGRAGKIAFQRKLERIRINNICWYKMIVWQSKAKNLFGIGTTPSSKEIDGSQCGRTTASVLDSA